VAESFLKTLVTLYPLTTQNHIPEELYLHHLCCSTLSHATGYLVLSTGRPGHIIPIFKTLIYHLK